MGGREGRPAHVTVTLHWWLFPVVCIAVAIALVLWPVKSQGDWDLLAGLPRAIAVLVLGFAALAYCLGHSA